jgi:hypothetical protein
MTKITKLVLLAILWPGSQFVSARADELPKFDVAPMCRTEASTGLAGASAQVCMADEQKAREQLTKEWEQFATDSRTNCTREATGIPGVRSYVELLTCLQIAKDAKKLPNE